MLRRLIVSAIASAAVVGVFGSAPASAQDQTINFFVGGFVPPNLYDRGINDVVYQDTAFLALDTRRFSGPTVGGEYLVGLGDLFDAGFGIGVYARTVHASDIDFVADSDLKLRIIPITATFRYLPIGHHDAIEPYVGGGVAILNWRYTEIGDFVNVTDPNNPIIVNGEFTGNGTAVAPTALGGIRFPVGAARLGFEYRYNWGEANLPTDQGFAGTKINLAGSSYLFTIGVRF